MLAEHWHFRELGRRVDELMKEKQVPRKAAARIIGELEHPDLKRSATLAWRAHASFTRLSVADLRRLGRIRTRTSRPPAVTHLRYLAMIEDKQLRHELIDELARQQWTCDELAREIRRRRGPAPQRTGHPRRVAATLSEGLDRLSSLSRGWVGHAETALVDKDGSWLNVPGEAAMPDDVGARLAEARQIVRQVQAVADTLDRRLGAVERRLRKTLRVGHQRS